MATLTHLSNKPSLAFLLLALSAALSTTATAAAASSPPPPPSLPNIGVTFTNTTTSADPNRIVSALQSMNLNSVRLPQPDPQTTRAFSYTQISLLLHIPNPSIPHLASNRSNAARWLNRHLLPFYPRVHVSIVSVGDDVDPLSTLARLVVPAMENVREALREAGIHKVSVSTTLSFARVIGSVFPPSSARFQPSVLRGFVDPVLRFIARTDSYLLINLHPYHLYRSEPGIPIGFALFQEGPFNFRDDPGTGLRYRNLFDVMVDAVISAVDKHGHPRVPLVVAETGWPSLFGDDDAAKDVYAELYVEGLVRHLRSGVGTPLWRDGVAGVFIYELFDEEGEAARRREKWGICYENMTQKYNVDFSGSDPVAVPRPPNRYLLSLMVLYLVLKDFPRWNAISVIIVYLGFRDLVFN